MKCQLCQKHQHPLEIGGMVTITCCSKIQILRSTVRQRVREMLEHDQDVVLVDTNENDSIFFDLINHQAVSVTLSKHNNTYIKS